MPSGQNNTVDFDFLLFYLHRLKKTSPYNDEQRLILGIQEKEATAFNYLYDNYSGALFGVINRIVQSEEIAEDVLQEAFVKIWKNADQYNTQKGTLFTWMLNISRNLAIDTLRSKSYKKETQNQNLEENVYQVDSQEQVQTKVDHIGLKEQVNQLKPDQKILIDMIYFEGYTQDDVSKELNIPLGTVKTRLRAAIQQLRKVIVR